MYIDTQVLQLLYRIKPDQQDYWQKVLTTYYSGYIQLAVEFLLGLTPEDVSKPRLDGLRISYEHINPDNLIDLLTMLSTIRESDDLVREQLDKIESEYNAGIYKLTAPKLSVTEKKKLLEYLQTTLDQSQQALLTMATYYVTTRKGFDFGDLAKQTLAEMTQEEANL